MKVVQVEATEGRRSQAVSIISSASIATVLLIFGVENVGPVISVCTLGITVAVCIVVLWAYSRHLYKTQTAAFRANARSITVPANWNGLIGKAELSATRISFRGKHGRLEALDESGIRLIELAAVRRIVSFTRATITLSDGSKLPVTLTADAALVASALHA